MIRFAKFLVRCLLRLLFNVHVTGMEHYHAAGNRVLIVANHSSLLDGLLLYAWLPETPTFAINTTIATKKSFKPYLMFVDLFLMDPASPLSVKSMIKFLKEDRKAVIFPEGRITVTGILMKIYEGPGLIADKSGATILPISIEGGQHSRVSYMKTRGYTRLLPDVSVTVLPPEKIQLDSDLQGHDRRKAAAQAMQNIMYKLAFHGFNYRRTVFDAVLEAMKKYGRKTQILEDINREPLTYQQIIMRSFILGSVLAKDSERGEKIGILLPNVSATVITFLALQYLGRVPAMMNYSAGIQALRKACSTGSIKTVYCSHKFVENAGLEEVIKELEQEVHIIYLEDLRSKVTIFHKLLGALRSKYPRHHYRSVCKNQNSAGPATILFTSGSEGVPKGVVLSHENLLSNFAQIRCLIDFRPADVLFSCLPLFHSFGLNGGFLMPLLGGSRIYLYPTPLHYRLIPEVVYELQATILFGTNTFFRGYARHAHEYDFNTLRYVVAGAEKLQDDTQRMWMEKFGIRILQGYGVTECSPVISVNTPMSNRIGSVGQLIPDMQAYLEPVEGIHEGGELVVSGPNVMLGYLLHERPGEIVPPVTRQGKGWHATGDIANIDEHGFITILGRAKRFAKIGGEMISLTAVEELAAQTWPDTSNAAVSLPDEKKGEKIILVTNNQNATRKQIQEYARSLKVGELYIPRKVVIAEELPVLSTGKTDYISLTELALKEDKENTGIIGRLSKLVKKQDPAQPTDITNKEQGDNS